MKGLLEFKNIREGLKDVDVKKRIVTGYLSAFGNKDYGNDIIIKGAFTKTLNERKADIYFLNQHDWKQPHGKFTVLQEDEKGLYFESEPLLDTTYSSDLLKLYEAGVIKEHSIGYSVEKSDTTKDGVRTLKELKLYEGSNVTVGMNPNTPFLGFKSNLKELKEKEKVFIKALKDGTFTDETFVLLEIALKQLQSEAYELGLKEKEKSLAEPSQDTQIEPIDINVIKNFTKNLRK